MGGFKDKGFGERLSTASNAKQAMATKFLQKPGVDDPALIKQRAARAAVSAARDVRKAEREATRLAENARIAAEREAHAAAAMAAAEQERAEEARAAAEKEASDAKLEIAQKAARDARYAARKAR